MRIRITAPGFLLASVCSAVLMSSPLVTAPAAHAQCTAGEVLDQRTGVCWSQSQTTLGVSGTGGWCKPGRIGLCMAAWQNSQVPGAALQPAPPGGPAPRTTWPRG
ncbi:MAG: hypothetical protein K2X52_10935 [Mycobacteriaceae bacterium]|uniref:hypothetical protein n=1 Tax=Mycobacterium sp. 29Ha TaxID=2939268 RepID=UPI001D23AB7C|nr:hypothetical protein [Mycobacterium sp. 29Ha]MBY0287655.1 hypothetical protein [Mycobacteriaceae bacterium]MDV3132653.1 hypothetical protein [Mycobacterium sp. 29Ha]